MKNPCIYDYVIECPEGQTAPDFEEKCRNCPIMQALKEMKECGSVEW